jgi:hypothetical protein
MRHYDIKEGNTYRIRFKSPYHGLVKELDMKIIYVDRHEIRTDHIVYKHLNFHYIYGITESQENTP